MTLSERAWSGRQVSEPESLRDRKPSDYMRARRPHLFSDSEHRDEPDIPRALVEFHLETLTQRQQEAEFETFCRRLAEREITPNLRPQTGPTGGGDGKVDSETYPVDEAIRRRWFVADVSGGHERWAFAFSAKKDWRGKVTSDVRSAVGTGRGYTRVIFISNQAISSRKRSEVEALLSAQTGVAVTIHDRAWILEKVFTGRYFDLLGGLGLDVPVQSRKVAGPQDLQSSRELEELEAQIADVGRYEGTPYALAEACLDAALLARRIGRPREEIEGKFLRAERNAQRLTHTGQLLRIAYAQAWTTHFWFDDAEALARQYSVVEERAAAVGDITAYDLLLNLFLVLQPAVARGQVSREASELEPRRARLTAALEGLACDEGRPTSALRARTALLLLRAAEAYYRRELEPLDGIWAELEAVVLEAEGHLDYPLQTLSNIVQEMGNLTVSNPAFDNLFETVVEVLARRGSETAAGRAHAKRGRQKLTGKRPYDAIRLYGRAITRLSKEEAIEDLVPALGGLCVAYETVGLPWAARTAILTAAERSLTPYLRRGQITTPALASLRRLNWLELRLGRPAQALTGMQLEAALRANVTMSESVLTEVAATIEQQDLLLAALLLRLPLETLSELEGLPAFLDAVGLDHAWMAVLFALGDVDRLNREAGPLDPEMGTFEDLFDRWFHATEHLLAGLASSGREGAPVVLRSRVLGMKLDFIVTNRLDALTFAESVLGALEALLATSLNAEIVPYRDAFTVAFEADQAHSGPPEFTLVRDGGVARGRVRWSPDATSRKAMSEAVFRVVGAVVGAVSLMRDPAAWNAKIAEEEEGYGRAMSHFDVGLLIHNIFGDGLSVDLSDFTLDEDGAQVPLQRTAQWAPRTEDAAAAPCAPLKAGSSPPPAELLDAEAGTHADRRIASLIDLPLWDAAGWSGCAMMWTEAPGYPPYLALIFKNIEAGRLIFEGFRARFGEEDREGELRLAIVRRLHRSNVHAYGVIVGQDFDVLDRREPMREDRQMLAMSRIQTMEPTSSRNLDGFLERMRAVGGYFLAPAAHVYGEPPEVIHELALATRHIVVRQAWTIGENDSDGAVLDVEDPPPIPAEVAEAPVLRALAQIKAMRALSR